jgi:hypothetical protein
MKKNSNLYLGVNKTEKFFEKLFKNPLTNGSKYAIINTSSEREEH